MGAPQWIPGRKDAAGLALAGVLGAASLAIVRALPSSPLLSDILVALVLGALVLNVPALRRLAGLAVPGADREADRYASGLRFVGKWVLRASIILMGFKVQTKFFGAAELALIAGVAAASLPSTFFVAHAVAVALGVRRPMGDLVASGTMICGASAVNAVAPVVGAHREEQGIAIGTVFLFSVVALFAFRPIAALVGLDAAHAGIWSGLAVNDLASAVAVGAQMGEPGGTMAAAAKSARVLMLAPMLVGFALVRHEGKQPQPRGLRKTALDQLPRFLLGYMALAVLRAGGDRLLGDAGAWRAAITVDQFAVDLAMVTVAASIGLHLELRRLLSAGFRALVVGGASSAWMASLTLAMIVLSARGGHAAAALVGLVALLATGVVFRARTGKERLRRELRARFDTGAPLSLSEATRLLDGLEHDGALDDALLRKLMAQLHPAIGELIPVRESPLPHGEGCRWVTYWEGKTGWALVAVCRESGSATPIHAHPHRLIGKSIEGRLEELRFAERGAGALELLERRVLSHNDLVETDGPAMPHLVRAVGDGAAIDLQLRGPELGTPGRRYRTEALDVGALRVGERLAATLEIDDRPGQGGEGARAGRVGSTPPLPI